MLKHNLTAVGAGQLARGAETKAAASNAFVTADTVEALEQMRGALRRNAFTGVTNGQFDRTIHSPGRNAHTAAPLVVLDRVFEKLLRDHPDKCTIRLERQVFRHLRLHRKTQRLGQGARIIEHALEQLTEIELLFVQLEPAGVCPCQEE